MPAYLLDTNVWLRAVQREAAQHALAVDALAVLLGQGDEVFVTAQNLIEFWSVASRPIAANGLGWPVELVQLELERVQAQFPMLEDTPAILAHWLSLVTAYQVTGRRVHDARLVAVMLSHGISHLLTFNGGDFRQFREIVTVEPGEIVAQAGQ